MELWRAHFNATFNGDDTNNPANEMIRPSGQTLCTILPQLHHQTEKKWPMPFSGLNATKPAVMMASLLNLIKHELVSCLQQLFCNIWSLVSMSSD